MSLPGLDERDGGGKVGCHWCHFRGRCPGERETGHAFGPGRGTSGDTVSYERGKPLTLIIL